MLAYAPVPHRRKDSRLHFHRTSLAKHHAITLSLDGSPAQWRKNQLRYLRRSRFKRRKPLPSLPLNSALRKYLCLPLPRPVQRSVKTKDEGPLQAYHLKMELRWARHWDDFCLLKLIRTCWKALSLSSSSKPLTKPEKSQRCIISSDGSLK